MLSFPKSQQKVSRRRHEQVSSLIRAKSKPQWDLPIGNIMTTLWLFTLSDIKTFVMPMTAFAFLAVYSGPPLVSTHVSIDHIVWHLPRAFFWSWLNTLVFNLSNQRHSKAVAEDALNKPWRPLPAGRITSAQTTKWLLSAVPLTILATHFLGAKEEASYIICGTWLYNDLGAGDEDFLVRNAFIAVAYMVWGCGTLKVLVSDRLPLTPAAHHWLVMIGLVIFTTISMQDLKDQDGDKARGRRTAPLVLGELPTRRLIAAAILFWSAVCPTYWNVPSVVFVGITIFGGFISLRVLLIHSKAADQTTWKLWSYWLIALFGISLWESPQRLVN